MRKTTTLLFLGLVVVLVPGFMGTLQAEDIEGDDIATARIRHLLRRATYGVRPGDVEEVKKMGIEAWIDRQLEPQMIPDPEVEKRLEGFESLKLGTAEYVEMMRSGMSRVDTGPPKAGEDRIAKARRRQAERNRLRNIAFREVPQAILLQAVYSERQLQQVMADFWRNHFNVDINKDNVRYYIPHYEATIYKHVFGKFEDLLLSVAKHPAMLFYLDNYVSQAPMARAEKVRVGREDEKRTNGLNENYARELLELHTFGADRGYEQDDVIQLALVLTGWSIENGEFYFRKNYHARGNKRVVGKSIRSDEVSEGEQVIKYLSNHKNTRWFVVMKMARFLQGDEPSEKLIEDVGKVWAKTKGDLKAITKAILMHDDFYAKESVLTKAKTPLEFMASALRVTGAEVKSARSLMNWLMVMGQPILQQEDPTGYPERAVDWMDTGVLATRWQFALDLLSGRIAGVSMEGSPLYEHLRQPPDVWEYLLQKEIFAGERPGSLTMAPFRRRVNTVRKTFRRMRIAALRKEFNILATLLLGSPEFQRQ